MSDLWYFVATMLVVAGLCVLVRWLDAWSAARYREVQRQLVIHAAEQRMRALTQETQRQMLAIAVEAQRRGSAR